MILLKGKENYANINELERKLWEYLHSNQYDTTEFIGLIHWSLKTTTGDLSELHPSIAEKYTSKIKLIRNNKEIPHRNCFYQRTKKSAKEAQIIITNHALLLTDKVSTSSILPQPCATIIDEAHTLESVATQTFAVTYSRKDCIKLCSFIKKNRGNASCTDSTKYYGKTTK